MTRRFQAAIVALLLLAFGGAALADYQVRDGNGNIITIKSGTTGAGETLPQSNPSDAFGNSLFTTANPGVTAPATPVPDVRQATPATITIVDSGSATASGQNGASIVSGAPSAASAASFTLNGMTSARVELNGTWAGTLAFESSIDGGTTYVPTYCMVQGTLKLALTVVANGNFLCNTAGTTNFRIRATAFSSGVAAIWVNLSSAEGPVVVVSPRIMVDEQGQDPTFHAAIKITAAASATDIVVVQGSATKIVKIRKIRLVAVAASAITVPVSIVRRSAGDTGGASSGVTLAQANILDPGPTAQVSAYTANPSGLGTAAGTVKNGLLNAQPATAVGALDRLVFEFGNVGAKPLELRGVSDFVAINLNATTITTLYGDIEFTEEF
jgi:hypothetical protein